jgi:GNAT superfamily N-acetyltransferase
MDLSIKYPFDSSIDRPRMVQFMRHLKTGPSPGPSEKERWELDAMYIHPLYQRRGFGGKALEWGIERAQQEDVRIWVWSTDAGKTLYLKNGFAEVGRVDFGGMIPDSAGVTVSVMVWSI